MPRRPATHRPRCTLGQYMTGVPARIITGGASIDSTVVRVNLPRGEALGELDIVETSLPVGAYADAEVTPTFGLAGPDVINGLLGDPPRLQRARPPPRPTRLVPPEPSRLPLRQPATNPRPRRDAVVQRRGLLRGPHAPPRLAVRRHHRRPRTRREPLRRGRHRRGTRRAPRPWGYGNRLTAPRRPPPRRRAPPRPDRR